MVHNARAFIFAMVVPLGMALFPQPSPAVPITGVGGSPASPPDNDNFAFARDIRFSGATVVNGTLANATPDVGDPLGNTESTVWYYWVPSFSGRVQASLVTTRARLGAAVPIGLPGTSVAILSGHGLLDSKVIGTLSSGPSTFFVAAGQSYWVRIGNANASNSLSTPFSFKLRYLVKFPANPQFEDSGYASDDFDTEPSLSGRRVDLVASTQLATFGPGEVELLHAVGEDSLGTVSRGGVWLNWVAPVTGAVSLTTQVPTLPAPARLIVVSEGDSVETLNLIRGGFNTCAWRCRKGEAYRIYILNQGTGNTLIRLRASGSSK